MKNKKAVAPLVAAFGGLSISTVIALLVFAVLIALGFGLFVSINKFYLMGGAVLVLGFIYAIAPAMTGKGSLDNKKIGLIMFIFLVGGLMFILPNTGLLPQATLGFTPIYCQDYEFTCCVEDMTTLNIGDLTNDEAYNCPGDSNYCRLVNFIGGDGTYQPNSATKGITNCGSDYNIGYCGLIGNCFNCDGQVTTNIGDNLLPGENVYRFDGLRNLIIERSEDKLVFCGSSGCTQGTQVLGANGCTFNPTATYDSSGNLVKYEKSDTSYTVPSGATGCILSWQRGNRHICGNVEEQCNTNSDCIGHTYGNVECTARTKQTYGCVNLGLPSGIIQQGSEYLFYNTPSNSRSNTDVTKSRCEIISAETVQCCGDTDCGSNAFCNTATFTCEDEISCSQDVDCGVSQQCNIIEKELQKPSCSLGTCDFKKVQDVECCSESDCAENQMCDIDYKCKEKGDIKKNCPHECCIGMDDYLDKPCGDGLFCIDNKCNENGCEDNDDCTDDQICDNGDCIDKEELECSWYQEKYLRNDEFKSWYNYIGIGKPTIVETPDCRTAGWVWILMIFSILAIMVFLFIFLLRNPKKGRKKKK